MLGIVVPSHRAPSHASGALLLFMLSESNGDGLGETGEGSSAVWAEWRDGAAERRELICIDTKHKGE